VRLVADPTAARTTHRVTASGAAGSYEFAIENAVSEAKPTSSAIVAESVLAGLTTLARPSGSFV
ncbi:TPA: aspartate dehydrogenase domain-containing protein, partial [Streptococcus pneumoniae]